MQIEILTPESLLYSGDIQQVRVPGTSGSFAVLHNHAPIMSTLEKGQIKITEHSGENIYFDIHGGVIQVTKNIITILISTDNL
ncbi:MAG: ATP synthase F1 subunit epsilon [Salinivirgaceae bacterium]|nr:ATP synthase F1 subunit epsilon [Salinivirgaceae bacterium]MDD4746452.1 ATP synthase F1 subunit epsilon [Salinivirgaceae bacterium]MDY0281051.1 ATP synthase F1 subunit epsilon [Salinivirgaceae bacterium]